MEAFKESWKMTKYQGALWNDKEEGDLGEKEHAESCE